MKPATGTTEALMMATPIVYPVIRSPDEDWIDYDPNNPMFSHPTFALYIKHGITKFEKARIPKCIWEYGKVQK